MIFFLIEFSICQNVFDFTIYSVPPGLILRLQKLEIVDIKLNKNISSFFSDWDDLQDLILNVRAEDSKGEVLEYGPFGSDSKLMGVAFNNKKCTLRFSNEGPDNIKFGIAFTQKINNYKERDFPPNFHFPVNDINISDTMDSLKSPFIYQMAKNISIPYCVILSLLGAIYLIIIIVLVCNYY